MTFNQKVYGILKAIALLWLPAAGTLYFALAGIWGFPNPEKVIGSIVAVDTFLGVVLRLSKSPSEPADGTLWINTGGQDKDVYRLDMSTPLNELPGKDIVKLDVRQPRAAGPS